MNDNTLRSDYFFMEEVLDTIPRARKVSKLAEEGKLSMNNSIQNSRSQNPRSISSLNKKTKRLVQQAQRRGITLQVMPPIMERHRKNTSWYCSSKDVITWKVEVVLEKGKKTFALNISELEDSISGRISKFLKETYGGDSDISSMVTSDNYQLLIKRLPSSADKPRFIQIEKNTCLKTVLEGLTIVEYPTIYCVSNENKESFPIGTNKITEEVSNTHVSSDPTKVELSV